MAEFGTLSGRVTITIAGQTVDIGVVHVPVTGRVNGSELVLSAKLGQVRDVIETIFAKSQEEPEPLAEWEHALLTPEPDPWPTAPLIVADWNLGERFDRGHGLLYRDDIEGDMARDIARYYTMDGHPLVEEAGHALTNVVPVRVVPLAEWEAFEEDPCVRTSADLIAATDALGLDQ